MAKPTNIRIDTGFFRNMKTQRLARTLGPDGIPALMRLWIYAAEYHQDGVLTGLDDVDIDTICNCAGHAGGIRSALMAQCWIDADGITLHDWAERVDHRCADYRIEA